MKKIKSVDLSIVIGNFNTKNLLRKNLLSLKNAVKNISYEVIVIDDGSSDGSRRMVKNEFSWAKVFRNNQNLGYSRTYNKGSKKSFGRYILHLNSDIYFPKHSSFFKIISFMDNHPEFGIAGCKILKPNGQIDKDARTANPTLKNIFFQFTGLSKLFPKNKFFAQYSLSYIPEQAISEVERVMGAFMLIRKEVIKKIGYLDERFKIFAEDTDYCYRARLAGYKILYYSGLSIVHRRHATTDQNKLKYTWLFHKAMLLYYNKHYAKNNPIFMRIFVYSGIITRFLFILCLRFFENLFHKFS